MSRKCMGARSLAGVAMLVAGVAAPAWSAVTFNRDTVIASNLAALPQAAGVVKIAVSGSGAVDLAWYDGTNLNYSQVNPSGQVVVNGALVSGPSGGAGYGRLMGISNVGGVVRIGAGAYSTVTEFTRQSGGAFAGSDTGVAMPNSTVAIVSGGYATNPVNGLGGFVYKDSSGQIDYVSETSQGVWSSQSLSTIDNGNYSAFAYSSAGSPIAAYKDKPGTNYVIEGGVVGTSITSFATKTGPTFGTAIAVGTNGEIYVLDARDKSHTNFYSSSDGGQTWSSASTITSVSNGTPSGDKAGYAIAVSPDSSQLAALVYDSTSTINLAVSTDSGATWALQQLSSDAPRQIADLGFDSQSHLYVAYYNSNDQELHLLSTAPVPEPTTALLAGLGMMALGLRRRR